MTSLKPILTPQLITSSVQSMKSEGSVKEYHNWPRRKHISEESFLCTNGLGVQKFNNIKFVNADCSIDLESCITGKLESLHSTHHKHEGGARVIDYARGFGNTGKEGLNEPLIILPTRNPTLLCHPTQ